VPIRVGALNCCTTVAAGLVPGRLPLITFDENSLRFRFVASNSVFAVLPPWQPSGLCERGWT
jgi:hypothetical protein